MFTKGQVWIETVLYTLIGLALIAMVLAFATPKINKTKDAAIVEQSIEAMQVFDDKVQEIIARGPGNVGTIQAFNLKRGEIVIDSEKDKIYLFIDGLTTLYSEPGVPIEYGRIIVTSQKGQKTNSINMTLDYNVNITFGGADQLKKITASSVPYKFSIENIENKVVDIKII